MDAMAQDVIDVMDALDVPDATVVGHSMGSFVARRAAALAPERITRLVLVGAGLRSDNEVLLELRDAAQARRDPVDPVPDEFLETVIAESLILDAATWKEMFAGLVSTQRPRAESARRCC
jgi:pimeloyl-ACP methyl ester carboxylesterase